jgi:hypothetical protein
VRYTVLLLPLLAALFACDSDSGGNDGSGGGRGCPGNANVDPQSASELAPEKEAQGYLCPLGNQHWFRIQVPAGQPVVNVSLRNDTPLSQVKLSYTIRDADGQTGVDQSPPPQPLGNAKQVLRYSHCVPKAGTYYLQVQSFGNEGQDTRNPFFLSYTTAPDPDTGEPGNSARDGAVQLTGQDQRGFIACKGDRDFYKITVGDGRLLDISLTTPAPTPALNLKYTLLDDQLARVADDAVPTGMVATSLKVVRVTPRAGTYYLVVEDQAAGSDGMTPYTLKVRDIAEPDMNERPARNDSPGAATSLGTWACGGGASFGRTAFLAARADVDWYRITVNGVGPACQGVLEVAASWGGGGQALRPQVSFIYSDPASPCTTMAGKDPDKECAFLSKDCGENDNNCQHLGNTCDRQRRKCTGAAVCMPDRNCGAVQFTKSQAVTMTPTPAFISTAQPLIQNGTYYIRVRDYQSQGYDTVTPYSLALRAITDTREPNNFYSPYASPPSSVVRGDAGFIMRNKITLGQTVTAKIAYERDQDFYVLDHPCPGADCTLAVDYASSTDRSPVYFTYQFENQDGRLLAGWPATPMMRQAMAPRQSGRFGDGDGNCLFASKGFRGPFFLWVADWVGQGGPKWDLDATYTFTVRKVMDGCSAACRAAPFNCGQ